MTDRLHDLIAPSPADDRPAVTTGGTTLTYAELRAEAGAWAARLAARGLGRGDRVLLTSSVAAARPACLYAASRIGAVFSVIHDEVRGEVLRHVLTDCEPRLFLTTDPDARAVARAEDVPAPDPDDPGPGGAGADGPPSGSVLPVDPLCLIYTSGTTALPKAVVSTHAQALFATRAIGRRLRYDERDTVFSALPLSFDYGLYQLFLAAAAKAHVVLASPAEAGPRLLANLVRHRATVFPAVPPLSAGLLSLLSRRPQEAERVRLRLMTNTGAATPRETLSGLRRLLPGLAVQLMFGLTECKRVSIMEPDEDRLRPDAVGRPLDGTEVFTVDEDGRRLPPGSHGELTVRGPHVMSGYWRRPELTARRFVARDGLFPELRTGDYGVVGTDGYVYFQGRRDDVYKQDGFRVSSVEVEAAARALPGVDEAAVLVPAPGRPAVLVTTGTAAPQETAAQLGQRVERYKVPPRCHALDRLPTNANGKTDKKKLAAMLEEDLRA
ncbi:class I adenylate-forming enzyme family protein [Streptomyces sp. TRM 70351]|uniref:class I adenylate-forming enzyme family protein n=1 Tax=Streptomyces sp. TRM 70351 TaxID=3116552 RepID=UPI002E7B927C|nr:class I adenylate-forming enzyme family protein [Streptomyces sp. TRM 70351]MEE1927853.1 class I adenylate-forming enzyme family protein [Streptomyces sp. TRM 70351]